jgi:hypothetical protein
MKWLKRNLGKMAIVAVLVVGSRYAQDLQDWYQLFQYQAPPQIAKLATATTMTEIGRRLFYVNQPTIESHKSPLNRCKGSEHTVVLGCYVAGTGIFIQAITDPRLQGVMEVTAAHETLHVAYQRMSLVEQMQIDRQLEAAFTQLQHPRIKQLIETYKIQDPNVVNSELHSIFGTEVRNITPELERHYRKYFTDRSAIVALSERYEGVFASLQAKTKYLSQQIVTQKPNLEEFARRVKLEGEGVEADRNTIQRQLATNPAGDYRAQVAIFNDRVRNFNQLLNQLKEREDAYNQLVNEYNSFTLEEKSLMDSLQNKSSPQLAR